MSQSSTTVEHLVVVLIYAGVLCTLVTFAIYDVQNIVDEYANNNRMISVRRHPIHDRFPYLDDIRLCLYYRVRSQTPFPSLSTHEYLRIISEKLNGIAHPRYPDDLRGEPWSVYLDSYLDLIIPFLIFDKMDHDGIDEVADFLGMPNVTLSTIVNVTDRFLSDPHEAIARTFRAWSTIRPLYIRDMVDRANERLRVTDMMDTHVVCFEIPLRELGANTSQLMYAMDFVHKNFTNDNSSTTPEAAYMIVPYFLPNQFTSIGRQGTDRSSSGIFISLSNTGVYDFSTYPPCTNEYVSEILCLHDLRLRTVEEVCNCTQFSRELKQAFKRWNATIAGNWTNNEGSGETTIPVTGAVESEFSTRRYCTGSIYLSCMSKAVDIAQERVARAKSDGTCRPCVYNRNTQSVTTFTINEMSGFWDDDWYARTYVRFICMDEVYLRFEEKPQLSLAQFIAQIGGDLGLYVGFSLASVLQLIVFSYQMCRRRRRGNSVGTIGGTGNPRNQNQRQKRREEEQSENRFRALFRVLFRFIVRDAYGCEEREAEVLREQESHLRIMAERVGSMEERMADMTLKFDRLLKRIEKK